MHQRRHEADECKHQRRHEEGLLAGGIRETCHGEAAYAVVFTLSMKHVELSAMQQTPTGEVVV